MVSGGVLKIMFQRAKALMPLVAQRLGGFRHRLAERLVEFAERLARVAVLDQFDDLMQPRPANVADDRMPLRQIGQAAPQRLAHLARALDQVFLAVDFNRGDARRARQRVGAVGQPRLQNVIVEVSGDLVGDNRRRRAARNRR